MVREGCRHRRPIPSLEKSVTLPNTIMPDDTSPSVDLSERIEIVRGDITKLEVDAIVNAANETLLGGGGVDGAIHRAAGRALLEACRLLPEVRPNVRCPTGEARITPGFNLRARHVIHTVGPVFHGGKRDESALLRAAYRNSLELAATHGLHSVAFPAISTGVYHYPLEAAAEIAVDEAAAALQKHSSLIRVLLVAFNEEVAGVLEQAKLEQLARKG
jgi:O-acetyl-ADP-ribose deacetylase